MSASRLHSSNVRVEINDSGFAGLQGVSINEKVENLPLRPLGRVQNTVRLQNKNTEATIGLEWFLGKESFDPFFDLQDPSDILSVTGFSIKIRDELGSKIFANSALTKYAINVSVGELIKGSAEFISQPVEQSDLFATDINNQTEHTYAPSVPQKLTISGVGDNAFGTSSFPIQSFNFSFSLEQRPQNYLGQRTNTNYMPKLPVEGDVSFNFLKTDLFDHNITGVPNAALSSNSFAIIMAGCDGEHYQYDLSGCKLLSIDENTDLDGNIEYTAAYSLDIGNTGTTNINFTRF